MAIYPKSGKPETIYLEVIGNVPSPEEAEKLTKISFDKKPAGKPEVKEAMKQFFTYIVIFPLAVLFGLWVLSSFGGLGALIWGGGALIAAPITLILSIQSLLKLRAPRKKEAFDAMKCVWQTALIGDADAENRFGKSEYALSFLQRIVPSAVPFPEEKVSAYIAQTRKLIGEAADTTAVPIQQENKDWNQGVSHTELTLKEEQEPAPGVKRLHAVLTFQDRLHQNKQDMIISELEIDICQTYICADGYWFPYEIISPISLSQQPHETTQADELTNTTDSVDAQPQ